LGVDVSLGAKVESSHDSSLLDVFVEWDEPETILSVAKALRAFGDVVMLEAVEDFPERLAGERIDFLFNMAEGLRGPNREAHVPAIAEFLGIPYLGSDPLTLCLTLHKARAKEILIQRGVATPPFLLVETASDLDSLRAFEHYPAFLKPAWEGSSKGIAEANLVETPDAAWFLFVSGAVGITAMLLPGVSGAFILLILGMYDHMIGALHHMTDNIPTISLFVLGAVAGAAIISQVIALLLKKFHTQTLYILLGLVMGSLSIPIKRIITATTAFTLATTLALLGYLLLGIVIVSIIQNEKRTS